MKSFKNMNWKQRFFAACFFVIAAPYMLYSLFIQHVVYNAAVFLFNLDIKTQYFMVRPYDYFLNKLEDNE